MGKQSYTAELSRVFLSIPLPPFLLEYNKVFPSNTPVHRPKEKEVSINQKLKTWDLSRRVQVMNLDLSLGFHFAAIK